MCEVKRETGRASQLLPLPRLREKELEENPFATDQGDSEAWSDGIGTGWPLGGWVALGEAKSKPRMWELQCQHCTPALAVLVMEAS